MYKFLYVVILALLSVKLAYPSPLSESVSQKDDAKVNVRSPLNWLGKEFILLNEFRSLQHYGYQSLRIHKEDYVDASERNPDFENDLGSLLYNKFVGDIIKVTSVTAKPASSDDLPREYNVVFMDEKKSIPLYADTTLGIVGDIAPVEELDLVKKAWVGKTIWARRRSLRQYDVQHNKESSIKVPLGEPLKVIDAVWGFADDAPVLLVVERNTGQKGFYDIAGTPVNKDPDLYDDVDYWRNIFYDDDPRKDYHWPQSVWNRVCNGEISIGMTFSQVELALDSPHYIKRSVHASGSIAQWVYKHKVVYFGDGKVTAIQDK